MKRLIGKVTVGMILVLAFAGAVFVATVLKAVEVFVPPTFSTSLATVQHITAKSWLVFDLESGAPLYTHEPARPLPIASITKLPAAKVFYEHADIWATTTVTWRDVAEDGQAGKLVAGEVYSYHTLLFPLLLESSNDAAYIFMRSHPQLVDEMNVYAATIGLNATHFVDSSGLGDGNVSTATDVGAMLRDLYLHDRHLIDITHLREYYSLNNGWLNNNPYIADEHYLGGKHGYTYAANRTAAALFEETLKNGAQRKIGYVLLGSDNLDLDMKLLRDHVQHHVVYE